ELSTWALVAGVATGVATALVAAWLPARDAALVSPLVAVRTAEGAHPMRRWQPRGTIVAAVLLTGGALWAETRFDSPWCGNVAPLDESVGDRLAAVAGVARVERVRLAEHDYRGARISIDSLDASAFAPEREADFSFAAGDARAALAAVRAGTGVLVSRNFARQFDVGVGTTLRLDTPAGPFEAPVAGVVVDYVSPRGSV